MPDYKMLTKDALIRELELKEDLLRHDDNNATRIAHDLQVHQIELEIQNRELRDKQQELETARDMYATLYDFAPVGFLTLDAEGIVRGCNLTATGLLQQTRSEILKKPFIAFLSRNLKEKDTSDITNFYNTLHNTLESRQTQNIELQLELKDICFDVELVMAVSSEHGADEVLVTLMDITERKKQERKLKHKMHELDQMNIAMIDREMRMIELKAENAKFKLMIGDIDS
jgi:two-component system, NarL family, sensor histidine kinase UhpB